MIDNAVEYNVLDAQAEVINADALQTMMPMPFPDVMIVDPPYSKHVHKSAVSQSIGGGARKRELGFDHLSPALRRRICYFAANVKRWSVIYSDIESLTWWRIGLEAAGAKYVRSVPWIRFSMPQLSGDRPPTGCEMLIIAYGNGKGRKHWNGPGNLLSLNHTCLRGESKHKTEKPLDQLLDLVSYFSDEGEHVFDPCTGSGTTGMACRLLKRKFTGFEIDAPWAKFARERIGTKEMSERDRDRYSRWLVNFAKAEEDKARIKAHTSKVRAKLDARPNAI